MLVSRISPAPSSATCRHHATASMPVGRRPPWVNTSHRPGPDCLASTATTTHWLPNFCAASRTSSGRATAAELMLHLSVPASSSRRMSSVERIAAADGQRQEHPRRGARHHVQDGVAVLVAGGDVEEAQFVRAGRVIQRGLLDRIAGVAQGDEVHALDDAAVLHVQAGNDSQFQHGADC